MEDCWSIYICMQYIQMYSLNMTTQNGEIIPTNGCYLIGWRVHPSEFREVLFNSGFNGFKGLWIVQPFSLYQFVKKRLEQQQTTFTDHRNKYIYICSKRTFIQCLSAFTMLEYYTYYISVQVNIMLVKRKQAKIRL